MPDGAEHRHDQHDAEPMSPEFSDDALALEFSAEHDGRLVHVAEWGQWRKWDGCRWATDNTLTVFDLARAICRRAADRALGHSEEKARLAAIVASAQKVAAVERLARSDRRHARASDDFDADPFALNTPAGVVDLRTGTLRPHRRGDYFTKVTGAGPGGDCPRFLAFLQEVTGGDRAFVAFLRRWFGYCLTGSTREHKVVVLKGPGGNGKSLLLSTIADAIGDYATSADTSLFTAGRHEQHPTGLADLRGARLVVAQETEAGARLAEARLKALTGGDRVKARFMRADFFEFTPTFKLVMATNHSPAIRSADAAMRRRLLFLPFTYVPPMPDPELPDRLRAELPGILAWLIAGCLEWQEHGLEPPAVVLDATAAYFAEQDLLARWIAERTERQETAQAPATALYRDWQAWARDQGEEPGTVKAFSEALERVFAKKRTKHGQVFLGLRLRPSDTGVM
ncbi:phage/plasmid primase, P4 family [Falsiroseomonas sp.]|uniref:phage/plasmid primase, P4 family n=1 Tax=Falsiroseomonas sp. TaxID=2870721 RepID=UPI0035679300